jgi:glutamate-1-semialdehyde aminotransferase
MGNPVAAFTSMARVRLVSIVHRGGISAIRLARTSRERRMRENRGLSLSQKHSDDALLAKADPPPSRIRTPWHPRRLAFTADIHELTATLPYNDTGSFESVLRPGQPHRRGVIVRARCVKHGKSCLHRRILSNRSEGRCEAGDLLIFDRYTGIPADLRREAEPFRHRPRSTPAYGKIIGAAVPVRHGREAEKSEISPRGSGVSGRDAFGEIRCVAADSPALKT